MLKFVVEKCMNFQEYAVILENSTRKDLGCIIYQIAEAIPYRPLYGVGFGQKSMPFDDLECKLYISI